MTTWNTVQFHTDQKVFGPVRHYVVDADGGVAQIRNVYTLTEETLAYAYHRQNHFERYVIGRDIVGLYDLSTVMLGLDHGYTGMPVLWETMLFGTLDSSEFQVRWTSRAAAEQGHTTLLRALRYFVLEDSDTTHEGELIDTLYGLAGY